MIYLRYGILAAILALSGCVDMFVAKTTAIYRISPDGSKEITYISGKEQQGLAVSVEETGNTKTVHIAVDKSLTPEAAIAAALSVQTELIKQLIPLLAKGGKP